MTSIVTKLSGGLGLLLAAALLTGCEKYLDIRTKGSIVPGETQNYRYLLNNSSELEPSASVPDITADDVALPDSAQQQALSPYLARAYTWQSFFYESTAVDNDWDALYHTIYVANTVAEQVLASTGGTEAQKQELLAEAQVHRAHAYLTLVNMYARQYDPATAATDPGVPLVLTSDVGVSLPRVSVQAVYTQVIQDLTTALPYLPTTYTYNTQPTKAAAYALLARTYLQQRVYPSAQQSAESALALKSTLNDLQTFGSGGAAYPNRLRDPEIILSKIATSNLSYSPDALRLNDDLIALLDTTDLRYKLFTVSAASVSSSYTGRFFGKELLTNENRNTGPSVPEMLLVKAECQARQGNANGAIATLNTLRAKRFSTSMYQALPSGGVALQQVLDERRRELFCRGLRWFDQKRLNLVSRPVKLR